MRCYAHRLLKTAFATAAQRKHGRRPPPSLWPPLPTSSVRPQVSAWRVRCIRVAPMHTPAPSMQARLPRGWNANSEDHLATLRRHRPLLVLLFCSLFAARSTYGRACGRLWRQGESKQYHRSSQGRRCTGIIDVLMDGPDWSNRYPFELFNHSRRSLVVWLGLCTRVRSNLGHRIVIVRMSFGRTPSTSAFLLKSPFSFCESTRHPARWILSLRENVI
jgi:hypothetical protein